MLELDHLLCFVEPGDDWADRLQRAGWALDAGSTHPGQGSRNRRLAWGAAYLELVWVHDLAEAAAHPLRLDRRARWRATRASPFGFAFRGHFPEPLSAQCWSYQPDPAFRFSIHRDNEERPEQPLLLCMELDEAACRERGEMISSHARPVRTLSRALHAAALPLPPAWTGLPVPLEPRTAPVPHLTLTFGTGGPLTEVTPLLRLEG